MRQLFLKETFNYFLSTGQVESKERYRRFERFSEIFTWLAVIIGFLVLQLPFDTDLNRPIIYGVLAGLGLFSLVWYRLLSERYSGRVKSLISNIITIFFIAFIVHYTNGVQGYTIFFYFLAALSIGMSMPFVYSVFTVLLVVLLIFIEAFLTPGSILTNLSLAVMHSWAVSLVTFYGRAEAGEATLAKQKEEEIILEKVSTVGKLKDEFVFIISHKLKQPAIAINGYIETIFSKYINSLNEESKKILKLTKVNSERLSKLLDDLLDISQIEQGSLRVQLTDVFLQPVISEVLSSLFFEARNKKITLSQKGDLDIAAKADTDRLKEVLTNLIGNAIKYTLAGGQVMIEVRNEGELARILISDNGIGISQEDQKHLFEKFYRIENEQTKQVKGSGLGLFITKQLVEKMGGEIGITDSVGKGSTFFFTLPRW